MSSALRHVRQNAVAYLALFVALGGTSYAAVNLPNNSVGSSQLRNHSITPGKFNGKYINGTVRAWALVAADGTVQGGAGKPSVNVVQGATNSYVITWKDVKAPTANGDVSRSVVFPRASTAAGSAVGVSECGFDAQLEGRRRHLRTAGSAARPAVLRGGDLLRGVQVTRILARASRGAIARQRVALTVPPIRRRQARLWLKSCTYFGDPGSATDVDGTVWQSEAVPGGFSLANQCSVGGSFQITPTGQQHS